MQLSVSLIWLKVCKLSNWHKFIAYISSNKILTASLGQHWKIMPLSCVSIICQCYLQH